MGSTSSRLHRARRVDDEDHGCLLAQERALDVRASETEDESAQAEDENRRRHEARPGASGNDRREDVDVRVADGVARPSPLEPEPQADERREDDQAEQHPRALEAHEPLAHSA